MDFSTDRTPLDEEIVNLNNDNQILSKLKHKEEKQRVKEIKQTNSNRVLMSHGTILNT